MWAWSHVGMLLSQSWKQCNRILNLSATDVASLFVEWFYETPLQDLLCTPTEAASSGLRRWLKHLLAGDIGASDVNAQRQRSGTDATSSSEASDANARSVETILHSSCEESEQLEHALMLASFCAGTCDLCCSPMCGVASCCVTLPGHRVRDRRIAQRRHLRLGGGGRASAVGALVSPPHAHPFFPPGAISSPAQ